jgi:adenine deaminase
VLRAACINPALHYKLEVGLLREGDAADFIVAEDLQHFKVTATYIDGMLVAENGRTLINRVAVTPINQFDCKEISPADIVLKKSGEQVPVIEALDGQLITNKIYVDASTLASGSDDLKSDPSTDVLKMVVVNRYFHATPAVSFIRNFGFKHGAIASSVAHDSHNIIAVGVDDESICKAINLVVKEKGGVSCVNNVHELVLGLPVAGLMSDKDGYEVSKLYTTIDAKAKDLGSSLAAPFMTLSFMALLVIPHLKLSDKGLFDGDTFSFIEN